LKGVFENRTDFLLRTHGGVMPFRVEQALASAPVAHVPRTAFNGGATLRRHPPLCHPEPRLVCYKLGLQMNIAAKRKFPPKNCHPDRSEAKWRDLLFAIPRVALNGSTALPFVIPSAAEGSAVLLILKQISTVVHDVVLQALDFASLRLPGNTGLSRQYAGFRLC
jgi:hypothetical protein